MLTRRVNFKRSAKAGRFSFDERPVLEQCEYGRDGTELSEKTSRGVQKRF